MVDHYMNLLDDVQTEIDRNAAFKDLRDILEQKNNPEPTPNSVGFKYANNLFYCALLMYYDKFHNFDIMAVKKSLHGHLCPEWIWKVSDLTASTNMQLEKTTRCF